MNNIEIWAIKFTYYKIEDNKIVEMESIVSGWDRHLYTNREDCQIACDWHTKHNQLVISPYPHICYPYKTIVLSKSSPFYLGNKNNEEEINLLNASAKFNENIKQQVFKKLLDERLNNG